MKTFTAGNTFAVAIHSKSWSTPLTRTEGLRRFALAHMGTQDLDDKEFCSRLAEQTIRQIVPIALRAVGLEEAALRCEKEGTEESARKAGWIAGVAGWAAREAAAWSGWAAREADWSAGNASAAAVAAAGWAGEASGKGDEVLTLSANIAAEILENMKVPRQKV